MKTIPLETIDEVWERISNAGDKEIEVLARRMQEEQPFIMVYLLASGEAQGEEEGKAGDLLELGCIIWEAMSAGAGDKTLPRITGEELEAAEDANIKLLENLEEGSEMDWVNAGSFLISDYNQRHLLGAMLEALMSGYEDEPDLAPEEVGIWLVYLKTVIDCLDR
jgi:hypothetical protein